MSNTNAQLFAKGDTTLPVYGFGARDYGIAATKDRGRTAHVQFREQNSGFTPSEDYRAAKALPGLWRDLDRNGCPYVMPGGILMGLASVELENGVRADFQHQLAAANAGIRQKLIYSDIDEGVAVDIDSYAADATTLKADLTDISRVTEVSVGYANPSSGSTAYVGGNAPIGYNITHELSSAWEDVFTNQKFSHQLTVKTHWNNMYPVDNGFMYGGSLDAVTYTVDQISAMAGLKAGGLLDEAVNVPAAISRKKLGFNTGATYTPAAPVVITGMTVGAPLMPNPWLPGTLITVADFAVLAAAEDDSAGTSLKVKTQVAAAMGVAVGDLTVGLATVYGMTHNVGLCFKRQARAYSNDSSGTQVLSKHDIYAATYKYHVTVPGLGLSGSESEGIEADQESARVFAKTRSAAAGNPETGVDVIFANLHIK